MNQVERIAAALDRELCVSRFADASHNGLQVANSGRVGRVCCGVDASLDFFEAARARGAGLLICHHGLSWGDSLKRITGTNFRRLSHLIRNDMALYACHLPLDAHPRLGNNALLARALGLRGLKPFGLYSGHLLGFRGTLARPLSRTRFHALVQRATGNALRTMDFGPATVRTVGVVSGGAADEADEAGEAGLDAYVTGEPKLLAWHLAQEHRLNVVFAGHYATEVFGVRALAGWIRRRFGLAAGFIDLKIPF